MLVPSGIMANNLALMVMSTGHGEGVVIGSKSHIIMNERAAISTVARVMPWIIENEDDGTMNLDKIKEISLIAANEHIAPAKGIALESSHNYCNGRVLRPEYIS